MLLCQGVTFVSAHDLRARCLFLHQQIDIVDSQSVKQGIWSVHVEEKATERDVDFAKQIISIVTNDFSSKHLHIISCALLESVDFSMTNIIELICQSLFSSAYFPPAFTVVFASV